MAGPVGLDRPTVIEAAAALCDEIGPEQMTLAGLAGRVGVRSQSLYAHVAGIEGLRRDLALHGQRMLADELRSAAMGRSGREALLEIATAYSRFAATHPGLYMASLRSPGGDKDIGAAIERAMEPLTIVLRSYGLTTQETIDWYRVIWSGIHGFVSLRRDGLLTLPVPVDASFRHMIEAFADSLDLHARPRRGRV